MFQMGIIQIYMYIRNHTMENSFVIKKKNDTNVNIVINI